MTGLEVCRALVVRLILKGLRPCIKNFAHNLNSLDSFPISFLYFLIFL